MRCSTIFNYFARAEVAFVEDFARVLEVAFVAEFLVAEAFAEVLLEELLAVLVFVALEEQEQPLDLLDFEVVVLVFAIISLLFSFS